MTNKSRRPKNEPATAKGAVNMPWFNHAVKNRGAKNKAAKKARRKNRG